MVEEGQSPAWLDYVLAIPIVGLRFDPWINSGAALFESVRPILTKWAEDGQFLEIDVQSLQFSVDRGGFKYQVTPTDIVAQFGYSVKVTEDASKLVRVEGTTTRRYSEVL